MTLQPWAAFLSPDNEVTPPARHLWLVSKGWNGGQKIQPSYT